MFNNFFLKIVPFMKWCRQKYGKARQATDDNYSTPHDLWMLDNGGKRQLRIHNTNCFLQHQMVTRMHHSITLYVHCHNCLAHSQNCVKRLLASTCLTACLPVRPSARPSFRMEQLGSKLTGCHEFRYLSIFRKSVNKIQVSLKSEKNNGYCTWRPTFTYDHI
jgi:hypothetical protein